MVFKLKFQRCQKKSSSLFKKKNGLIPFELWTLAMETYFAESAKNCEQQSLAPVNESSFLMLLQMAFKRKFQRCQKKSSSLFEQKNGFIPFLTVDCRNGKLLCGIRKKLSTTVFCTSKSILISEASTNETKQKLNDVRRSRRHCLIRRTVSFHLNCGLQKLKRSLPNLQKIVNNSPLHQ